MERFPKGASVRGVDIVPLVDYIGPFDAMTTSLWLAFSRPAQDRWLSEALFTDLYVSLDPLGRL